MTSPGRERAQLAAEGRWNTPVVASRVPEVYEWAYRLPRGGRAVTLPRPVPRSPRLMAPRSRRLTLAGFLRVTVVLGVAVVAIAALRYQGAVVGTYGLTSPLSFRRVPASFVVGRTVALDSWGFSQRLNRLLGVGMENVSVATMGSLSADDMTITSRPAAPDPTDTIVELGLRREGRGTASNPTAGQVLAPAGPAWTTTSGDAWGRKRSTLARIRRDNVDQLVPVVEIDAEVLFADEWVSNTQAPPLTHDGMIFWITAGERLVAADVVSGEVVWDMKVPSFGYSRRGFALDVGPDGGAGGRAKGNIGHKMPVHHVHMNPVAALRLDRLTFGAKIGEVRRQNGRGDF